MEASTNPCSTFAMVSLSLSLSPRLLRLVKCSDVGAYFSGLIYQTNAQTRHKLGIPILRRRLVKVVWGWSSAAPGGRQPPRNYHGCNVGVEAAATTVTTVTPALKPVFLKRELSLPVPLSPPLSLSLSLRRPEATSPNLLRNAGIFFNPCFSQPASRPRQRRGNDDFIRKWPWREYVLIRWKLVFSWWKGYPRSRDLLESGKARRFRRPVVRVDKVNQNLGARFNGRILFSRGARWAIKSAATLTSEIRRASDEPTRTPAPAKDRALFKIAFNYEYSCCGLDTEPPVVGILVTR